MMKWRARTARERACAHKEPNHIVVVVEAPPPDVPSLSLISYQKFYDYFHIVYILFFSLYDVCGFFLTKLRGGSYKLKKKSLLLDISTLHDECVNSVSIYMYKSTIIFFKLRVELINQILFASFA